jgi:2-hydroxy-4-carboxymuconate semialdehyde hemiacetal dehydrogenase
MRVALAGAGAFGLKHLDALARIDGVEIAAVVSRRLDQAHEVADRYGAPIASTSLDEVLVSPDVDAVILATPTQLHAQQAIATMRAGKHVQVEIPLADSWADARRVASTQVDTGLVCMVGHTRRFNPSHQWIHQRIVAGELNVLQMDVQTYFFRRTQHERARSAPQLDRQPVVAPRRAHGRPLRLPVPRGDRRRARARRSGERELGIPMDMSIQLKSSKGQLCTLSLSFNNEGPLGTFFRYIGDSGTYIARYDDLIDGRDNVIDVSEVDVSMDGIELQDREFVAAINEGREPNASVHQVLACYEVLDRLDRQIVG